MLFNTPEFAVFFVLVAIVVYLLNRRQWVATRNVALLAASYGFYANLNLCYPLLLLFVTVINYVGARILARSGQSDRGRKWTIGVTIMVSLIPLVVLKYAPMYTDSLWLPVGLSFFTFQALTYSIDVYRRKIEVPFSFPDVALFVAFFPTLLSGPIERARNLIPQLRQKLDMNWGNLVTGAQHFTWGLFKKAVIADRLAEWVNMIYAGGASHTGGTLAVAAILYSFQIYCDFSGYASMAIGTGRMLGIRLMDNFQFPYFAASIKDFWRRWHISLTTWFTEYVYISLGGNRVSRLRWVLNISAVFLLSGVWHGATWSFVIWGAIHGILYLVEHFLRVEGSWGIYRLFVFVGATLAWMFFRIEDTALVVQMIGKMITGPWLPIRWGALLLPIAAATVGLLVLFIIIEWLYYRGWLPQNRLCRVIGFASLLVMISLFAASSEQFVYFKF